MDNCNFSPSIAVSAGGKDMSRMKSAILARKSDITKAGGMQNSKMLWVGSQYIEVGRVDVFCKFIWNPMGSV